MDFQIVSGLCEEITGLNLIQYNFKITCKQHLHQQYTKGSDMNTGITLVTSLDSYKNFRNQAVDNIS